MLEFGGCIFRPSAADQNPTWFLLNLLVDIEHKLGVETDLLPSFVKTPKYAFPDKPVNNSCISSF